MFFTLHQKLIYWSWWIIKSNWGTETLQPTFHLSAYCHWWCNIISVNSCSTLLYNKMHFHWTGNDSLAPFFCVYRVHSVPDTTYPNIVDMKLCQNDMNGNRLNCTKPIHKITIERLTFSLYLCVCVYSWMCLRTHRSSTMEACCFFQSILLGDYEIQLVSLLYLIHLYLACEQPCVGFYFFFFFVFRLIQAQQSEEKRQLCLTLILDKTRHRQS